MNKFAKNIFQVCFYSLVLSSVSIYVFLPTSFSEIIKFIKDGGVQRGEILDFKIKKAYANTKFDKFEIATITNMSSPFLVKQTKVTTNMPIIPTLPNISNLQAPYVPPIPIVPQLPLEQKNTTKLEVKSIISTENERKAIVSLNGKTFFVGIGEDSVVGYIDNITTHSVVINGTSYLFEKK